MWEDIKLKTQNGVDSLKEHIQALNFSAIGPVEILKFGLLGFIVGVLLKYFMRFIIIMIATLALAFWVLQTYHLVTIHYEAVYNLLMISPSTTLYDIWQAGVLWVQTHVVQDICMLLGLLVAWIWA